MEVILDTNALSDFLAGVAEVRDRAAGADRLCLPLIVIGEYRFGIEGSSQPIANARRLELVLQDIEILDLTLETTTIYGRIAHRLKTKGRPIPQNDIWISAVALQHDLAVLSRDVHFDEVEGLKRIAW